MDWWLDLLKAMDAHEGQAAWAQFAGAMIALGLALQQSYSAGRRERARDRAAATAAYTLVSNAGQAVNFMYGEYAVAHRAVQRGIAERIVNDPRLSQIEAGLLAFNAATLPDTPFVTGVTQAQTAVREFRQSLEAVVRPSAAVGSPVDPLAATQKLQSAAGIMVEPLLLMSPGARWRKLRHDLAAVLAGLTRRERRA